jgi:hypothetical protein
VRLDWRVSFLGLLSFLFLLLLNIRITLIFKGSIKKAGWHGEQGPLSFSVDVQALLLLFANFPHPLVQKYIHHSRIEQPLVIAASTSQ